MSDNAAPILLLTRPIAQSERFAAACAQAFDTAVQVLIAPQQSISFLPLPALPADAALILTSENGVRAYQAGGGKTGRLAYCVGDRTADVAREIGLRPLSAGGEADDLLALIRAEAPTGQVIHLHGRHVAGQIVASLVAEGIDATGYAIYDQQALPLSRAAREALTGPDRVIVPLFSPRSATLFADAMPADASPDLVCISTATRDRLPPHLLHRAIVAEAPTGAAMMNALARQLSP